MRSTFSDGPRRLFQESYNPLTNAIIAAMVVVFLSIFARAPFAEWLVVQMPVHIVQPWRWVTFAIVEPGIIGLIFSGLILFSVGGSLERSWGSRTFGIFFVLVAVVTALSFAPMGLLAKTDVMPSSNLVIGAIVVGWCMLNPDETINLYGLIPIKSRFIAIGICLITFFSYGWMNPLNGFLALSGCGFAALWAKNGWAYRFGSPNYGYGLGFSQPKRQSAKPKIPHLRLVPDKPARPKDDRFTMRDLNPLEFFAKRKRRKKFEKLMRDD